MGRERQKKKNRSSIPKVKSKLRGRTKAGKKKVNFLGNELIAQKWDHNLTVSQNYERLGLSARLNDAAGGTERKLRGETERLNGTEGHHSLSLARAVGKVVPQEARVERDPASGHILRIIRNMSEEAEDEYRRRRNPLNDPLNDLDEDESRGQETPILGGVVAELEAQAREEGRRLAQKKGPRRQSKREEAWIASLVEKHGDDISAMVQDMKLNPMQQSEGDIRRRIRIWRAGNT